MKLTTEQLDDIDTVAKRAYEELGDRWASPETFFMDGWGESCASHLATMDPATTLALIAEVRELRATIERVRELHTESLRSAECLICTDENDDPADWPCDTIQALGEEAS